MKKFVLALALVALLVTPTVAGAGGAETGHYSWQFFEWVENYSGGNGPSCYYGQAVHLVYKATNTWTFAAQNGDVRETLVQSGAVKIYAADGSLLDERPFEVVERFFDANGDVAYRWDYGDSIWYQAWEWYSGDLEEYQYIWKIPGVYDFRLWNRSGDWTSGWSSGSCMGSWNPGGDWPPHPPHPFNKN